MVSALLLDLEKIAAQLPFHLNDTDKVNEAFQQWRKHKDEEHRRVIDIWTYCFVRRYFLSKFTHPASHSSTADLDILVERVYKRVQDHEDKLVDGMRYASWVSVICKNTYLNFLRKQTIFVSIDQEMGPVLQAHTEQATHDLGLVVEGLRRAVARLPDYLRDITRLRLMEGRSYSEIEQLTGKSLPTIRSYLHKAIVKLRSDAAFLAFIGWSGSA